MKSHRVSLFVALGLAPAGLASGNAFNINEHDPRVSGRGGASVASNGDPSSIVFNPGGIAIAEGLNVAISGSVYAAEGSYTAAGAPPTSRVTTDGPPSVVPSVYLTSRVHERVAVGFGLHFPFGLAVSWPDGHPQQEVIQDQTLRTFFLTPSVGVNLNDYVPGLSIGGGVDIVPATIELKQAVVFGDTAGTAHLGGTALGFGGRVGVMYHPPAVPRLKLGAMWRSAVKLGFTGKGDFDIAEPFRDQLPPDGDIDTTVNMPMSAAIGVAYSPLAQLELEVNAVWIGWDTFKEIRINLPGDAVTVSPQDYENTVTFRVGAEYKLPAHKAALRAGFIYDPTPIPTTTLSARLPDIDRKSVSVGASRMFGEYGVHASLLWVTPGERETSDANPYMPQFKGTYGVTALVFSLGVSGVFGACQPSS